MKHNPSKKLTLDLISLSYILRSEAIVTANIKGFKETEFKVEAAITLNGELDDDIVARDKCLLDVKDGKFKWKFKISKPTRIRINFPSCATDAEPNFFDFYAEPGRQHIIGSANADGRKSKVNYASRCILDLKVLGSKSNDEQVAYDIGKEKTGIDYIEGRLLEHLRSKAKSEEEKTKMAKELEAFYNRVREYDINFISKHSRSFVSLDIVTKKLSCGVYEEVKELYDLLRPCLQSYSKKLNKGLLILKRGSIGKKND